MPNEWYFLQADVQQLVIVKRLFNINEKEKAYIMANVLEYVGPKKEDAGGIFRIRGEAYVPTNFERSVVDFTSVKMQCFHQSICSSGDDYLLQGTFL